MVIVGVDFRHSLDHNVKFFGNALQQCPLKGVTAAVKVREKLSTAVPRVRGGVRYGRVLGTHSFETFFIAELSTPYLFLRID